MQLEKEVVELRLQCDLARAQVEDLQQGAENGSNDRPPIVYVCEVQILIKSSNSGLA